MTSNTRYVLDSKLTALESTLGERDPFYTGSCAIPEFQRFLYYTDGNNSRRIDFSDAGSSELSELYHACKPAEFGQGGENVLDESYRKAGKMDLTSFSTPFDPHNLGIHDEVSKALLYEIYPVTMDMELYKLNVYGVGDFFKPHKDTPRSRRMFGSLVVALPAPHEGGQLVLRRGGKNKKEWVIDFADKLAATKEPSACFIAFYSDVEHEVLPVTSGYRVTLTYNLYHKSTNTNPIMSSIPTPFHQKLKQTLVDLVNDVWIYDPAVLDVNLLTTSEIESRGERLLDEYDPYTVESFVRDSLRGLTIKQAEGVDIIGKTSEHCTQDRGRVPIHPSQLKQLKPFYKDPVTEVLEVTPMESSITATFPYIRYGNEAVMDYYYGTACMLIALGPAESRKLPEA